MDPMDDLEAIRIAQDYLADADRDKWPTIVLTRETVRAILARVQRPHD